MEERLIDSLASNPSFHPSYFDQKDLSGIEPLPVSALIVTYNRSPHRQVELNPLYWAVESLLRQKHSGLSEIIIIDDSSTDYTKETVRRLEKETALHLRYYFNPVNVGSPQSRNLALKKAQENLVFFMDDDCILAEYGLFGLNLTYQKMREKSKIGTVHSPVYYRSSKPNHLKPLQEISTFNLDEAVLTSSVDSFPLELASNTEISENSYLVPELKILSPIPIVNLWGVFLADKRALELAGGFPTHFTWKNSYTEESELALRLLEQGFESLYQPDPKFQVIHLRYGFRDNTFFKGKDWRKVPGKMTLEKMVRLSNINKSASGNRVQVEEWAKTKITSFYVLFGLRSDFGAESWARKCHKNFVDENSREFYYYSHLNIKDPGKRAKIWNSGISAGRELVEQIQKRAMNKHFRSIARNYQEVRTTDEEPIIYIASQLGGSERMSLAEIGCGTGRYGLELLKLIPRASLMAIDSCKNMLKELRVIADASGFNGSVKTIEAPAEKILLEDESVDHLLTFNAIHHFNLEKFLGEANRVLKKAGTLFVYTRTPQQNQENIWGRFFPHFHAKENRLHSAEKIEKAVAGTANLFLDEIKSFSYPRRSSLERLCDQAKNKHYSTFQLYSPKDFWEALHQFEERLRQEFEDLAAIQWLDQNILYVIRKN